jgi:hypothetical protein
MKLQSFKSWDEVLAAARAGDLLWYQAPLDRVPRCVRVVRVFKNRSIRIDPLSNQADNLTANETHLARFMRKEIANAG